MGRESTVVLLLPHAAAEPGLHGGDAGAAAGRVDWAAKGVGDCRQGSAATKTLVEARRMANPARALSRKLTEIYVDGDACPVREEIYRVASRLRLNVFVVSNGSRPIRPPGTTNVRMVLVGDSADAADDWIAEHISALDVCVTSDIPLASRCLKKGARVVSPAGKQWTEEEYRQCTRRSASIASSCAASGQGCRRSKC